MSFLPLCANKGIEKSIAHCYLGFPLRPTFPGSSLESTENWVKVRKKRERVRTDTCDMEPHSARRAVTHPRRLLSETFAVSLSLPALSRPRLMILVLCNLTVTVNRLSKARLFSLVIAEKVTTRHCYRCYCLLLSFTRDSVGNKQVYFL